MIPVVHDRVRLGFSEETFLVVGVDYTRRKADVVCTSGEFSVIPDLPFDRLVPLTRTHGFTPLPGSAAA